MPANLIISLLLNVQHPTFSQLDVDISDLFIVVVVAWCVDVVIVVVGGFHFFCFFGYILRFGYKSIINHIRQLVDHYPLFYTKLTSFLPKSLYLQLFHIFIYDYTFYVRGNEAYVYFSILGFIVFFSPSVSNMLPERIL